MDVNTRAIIELAWARTLGLADDALSQPSEHRIERVDDSLIMFVTLWRHRVLIGPQWLLDSAAGLSDGELAAGPSLLALGRERERPGRLIGETVLAYTDRYITDAALETVVVGDDLDAVAALERQCPPDDVAEVGLASMSQHFVTYDDLDQTISGAGYQVRQGILAQIGVLTPPSRRRSGHATAAAAIATNDALDAGLVPQWQTRREHRAALALGRRLGYRAVGSQTTMLLGAVRS